MGRPLSAHCRIVRGSILTGSVQTTFSAPAALPPTDTTAAPESAATASGPLAVVLVVLFIVGHVAALRMITAAPYAVFQHYARWAALRKTWLELAVIALQTVACFAVIISRGTAATLLAPVRIIGALRLLVIAAVVGFSLVVPSESVPRTFGEFLIAAWVALAATVNIVLAVVVMPKGALASLRGWVGSRITLERGTTELTRPWDARLPWVVAGWVIVVCAVLARWVFDGVPHNDDGVAYLFQARMLAAGHLQMPAPPDAESFGMTHMIIQGTSWYGKFFPGWPALLSVGVDAGVPWMVNPVLGGVAIMLTHRLVVRLYDRGTANAAILLLAASPWLLATSSEMMSHAAALVWALLALLAIDQQRGGPVNAWSLVAGAALGALYLTRPFDAALLGVTAALWAWGVGGQRLTLGALAAIALVSLGIASLMFPYNAALTGSATLSPFRLWADTLFGPGVDVFGFGPNVGISLWRNVDPLPGHGAADVVLNANKNFTLVNFELFGWATGSLLLAVLASVLGPSRRGDVLMLGIPLIVIVGHSFYWAPGGPDLGARYWYLIIVPLAVLTVRGAQMLSHRTRNEDALAGTRIGSALALGSASALLCMMPWRSVTKYHRYRDIGGEVRTLVRRHEWDHALVFVHTRFREDYQSAFNFLSPRLGIDGPVFVRDAGPGHREAVVRQFPDRPVWIIGPARETHAGHLVVKAGPLLPGTVPTGDAPATDRVLQVVLPARR